MPTNSDRFAGFVGGFLAVAAPCLSFASTPALLETAYSSAWKQRGAVYKQPSAQDLASVKKIFVQLLRGTNTASVAADARVLGWQLDSQARNGQTWHVMAEMPGQASGRGLYAFSSGGKHAVQAPHVPTDGLTGEILLGYAQDGLPRAMAWNTVPRKGGDLAHLDHTYLIAFSRAFAEVHPSERILQLHGFDAERRRTPEAGTAAAIVSAGHTNPSDTLRAAVRCMRRALEPQTRLYGVNVRELGGTTNSVLHALQRDRFDGFIHVEMNLSLRERLVAGSQERLALFECLGGSQ